LQRINPQPHEARLQREQSPQTELIQETASVGFPHSVTFEPTIIQGHQEDSTPRTIIQGHQEDSTPKMSNLNPLQPKVEPASTEDTTGLRRSTRLRKEPERYMNGYLETVVDTCQNDGYECAMDYKAELQTENDTGLVDIQDPRVYAAKKKKNYDADCPNLFQAMNGEFAEQYLEAMKKEIQTLIAQKTWKTVTRSEATRVIKSTWVFKLKRLPDGSASKSKARYCVRGDMQQAGVDYFETYAPVVQWSTIRMLLTLVLREGWITSQVDNTNAFAQAELKEEVYMESPKYFAPGNGTDMVLHFIKSLYGLKQSPKTFFEKLRDGIVQRGFVQSIHDPCLFMKKDLICVIYVDDTIFAGPDATKIQEVIKSLGVSNFEEQHKFELRDEGKVGEFLGIRITKQADGNFYLTQTSLMEKVLKAAGLQYCNRCLTPVSTTPVGSYMDGTPFIVGMLMYLAANTRPDITYAVHQAARYTDDPRASHALAIKRILRYIKGTKDKRIYFKPDGTEKIDCYVDSYFAGLFSVEDKQQPISAKSRTCYVIMYSGVPIFWLSNMQTQIALSTMEAEYIALSQSMRDLIPIREILKEIRVMVFGDEAYKPKCTTHCKSFKDSTAGDVIIPQSIVYEDNQACLKFAQMPKLSPRTKHISVPFHWFRSKFPVLKFKFKAYQQLHSFQTN
jgi:hypothetical protein